MMRYIGRNIGNITMMTAALLLATACSDDDRTDGVATDHNISLVLGNGNYTEGSSVDVTRALPAGFVPFDSLYPNIVTAHAQIVGFFTNSSEVSSARFNYAPEGNTHRWSSRVHIDDGSYYLYGFMPGEDATSVNVSPYNGDYQNGAVMNILGLNALVPSDVCVIVGVKGHDNKTDLITDLDMVSRLGKFDYTTLPTDDYVYLLMDHLYAGLRFKAHIDSTYAKLRTVKIKKLELIADVITERVDVSVTIVANAAKPKQNVSYTSTGSATKATTQLFPRADRPTEFEVPVNTTEDFVGCYAPSTCKSFVLKTTYDVYDRYDNLIRENCVAENNINATLFTNLNTLTAGQICTIDLFIKPTFLYMLSDPDLDNPTITLQ